MADTQTRDGKASTLRDLTGRLAERGERPALIALRREGIDTWSYARLAREVERLAAGLLGAGVERGGTVALLADNGPEWVAACLAILHAGAVAVPLDVQLARDVLRHVLQDSGCRLVFADARRLERVERLGLDPQPRVLLLDAGESDERGWRRLGADEAGELPPVEPGSEAALFYTSGTTGQPKGVPLTHGNIVFQLDSIVAADVIRPDDRFLLPLPVHHVYPFVIGMLTPLWLGIPLVLPRALTGPELVRALREGEVTVVIGVPRLYRALYEGAQGRSPWPLRVLTRLSTWVRRRLGPRLGRVLLRPLHRRLGPQVRMVISGGAPLDAELAWKLEGLGWRVGSGYGLTETAPMLTLNRPGEGHLDTVGPPLPGVEVRIDLSVLPGEGEARQGRREGEILARGPNVFAGYLHLPDMTAEAFTPDGWFRTGDLGYLDGEGYLHVTGRVKTLIVTEGGENVQPDEVQEAYEASPLVREVGVFQNERGIVAVLVPETSQVRHGEEGERALRAAVEECSRQLPSYQRIADFVIANQPLPRTRLGKIQVHRLRELYEQIRREGSAGAAPERPMDPEEMTGEDQALLDEPAAAEVWRYLAGRFADQRLTPDTRPQLELGIDSMEWLRLTLEVRERTGVDLGEEAIARVETVRDLLREVAEQAGQGGGRPAVSPLESPEEYLDASQRRWVEPLGPVQRVLRWCLYASGWAPIRFGFRVRAEGLENLPPEGPCLLAPSHGSYLDPFAICVALGYARLRPMYWAGWTGVAFTNPLMRSLSRLSQILPVDPKRGGGSSLAFASLVLQRGQRLVWFPEGSRSHTGELQPFKPGIGVVLERYRVPVVPMVIRGAHEALPPGRAIPRFRRITVVFGAPVSPDQLEREGEGENPAQRIVHALHARVVALAEGRRDPTPPAPLPRGGRGEEGG